MDAFPGRNPTRLWRLSTSCVTALLGLGLFLSACDSDPVARAGVCEPVTFNPAFSGIDVTPAALAPVLQDAATRIVPAVDESLAASLSAPLQQLSSRALAGDVAGACDAFNAAAAILTTYAASAPAAAMPDLDALRIGLGLAHAWLTTAPAT